ncbi:Rho GTPase-activating protein 23 [Frankliniella fusca]|uniref:Rho GTPase-activating protein 23 n=1 Tax=Frankliniella fusca TaxID=407009 RepID=A0AAE1GQW7_9NEOP|nr:Rho GTPase-activating protein 23 [Frankliniella fusca]
MLVECADRARAPLSLLQTPLGSESAGGAGGPGDHIDLRCSLVEVASDYTKKKHVLRLNSASGSELLLQADTGADLLQWVRVLQDQAGDPGTGTGTGAAQQDGLAAGPSPVQGLSPTVAHKGIKKLTALRNRSPTGAAAAAGQASSSSSAAAAASASGSSAAGAGAGAAAGKARKQSQPAQLGALPLPALPSPSPKSKTWKGRVAKQFRKMHTGSSNGGNSPSSPTAPHAQQQVEGVTIGVPLEDCPPSTFCEAVPLLVELCTSIVEARGLEVIGIYRVPGNTAAVASLTDSINKGFDFVNLQDPRWGDVNVISSLLKSFFRRLPDSLFTTELYPSFIEADKIDNPIKRVQAIRKLIRELPEHHYETLKYLLIHLKRVVDHSHTNKMEARNLAIVFGPTLVRAGDDNMVTMVTDMSSQCRIVETLISNVDWFFSEDDSEEFTIPSTEDANTSLNLSSSEAVATASSASSQNQSLLLGNIHKVEGLKAESPSKDVSARDIVSSIITAANRKIQRGKTKKTESDQSEHKQVSEVVHRQKTKDHSNSGFMSDPDSPPSSASLKQKRCSLTDPMRIHVESNVSEEVKNNTEPVVPVASIPTITTSSPKTTASLALRYKSPASDDVAIMSYANLAQTTQERIKRFEQETKAMLERDLYRQNRDSQQWDEQRRQIERQWLEAKQELENDDALDSVIGVSSDKKVAGDKLRVDSVRSLVSSTSSSGSASGGATPPQRSSWRVGWGSRLSSMSNTSNSASSLTGNVQVSSTSNQQDAQNNGHLKRMKTGKEPRSGSLDSLQGAPAGERPQSHMSDEGGDLLATLTSTFDQKMKSLLGTNPPTSETSKPSSTKFVNQSNSSSHAVSMPAPKSLKPASCVTSVATPECKEDKVDGTSDASDRLHLLNCDDDIPFADTDAAELESRGPQPLSKPPNIQTQDQSSPIALLSFRDPSLHRASRILRSSTVPDNPTTLDKKETSDNPGTKCSPLRWSTPVNVADCNFVTESGRTILEKKSDANMHIGGGVNISEVVGSASNSPVKSIVTTGSTPSSGPTNMQCDKLIMSDSTKKSDCFQSSTKLKRSESLNKSSDRSDSVVNSKLRRSESLNKNDRSEMSLNVKLRRSESLNKSEKGDSKLKRSDSLTKTEKTESNMNRRRQQENRASRANCGGNGNREKETTKMFIQNATLVLTKLKRKNGMPERSIKRRHTVGGTKDFDKLHWLDNRLQSDQWESNNSPSGLKEKKSLRTSSPDLSSSRLAGILVEVSLLHSSDVNRPHSLPDPNLVSAVFKVPLESHV